MVVSVKKKNLTRKLIIASIIWLLLICATGGAYFWLDSDIAFLTQETQQKKSTYESNKTELESIAKNIKSSETAHARFIDFSNSDDSNKDLFRQKALIKKLSEISNELRAVKLSYNRQFTPFAQYKPLPGTDKVDVIYSPVTIQFSALTDVTAFKILKLLSEKLNGTVYFKKFTIEKKGEIDKDVLLKLSDGDIPMLVDGEIQFDWISIRLKDLPPETTPAAAPSGAPGQPGTPGQPGQVPPVAGGPNV